MKGITFTVLSISTEGKERLMKYIKTRDERLKKIISKLKDNKTIYS